MKKTYIVPCTKTVRTELVEMLAGSWQEMDNNSNEFVGDIDADVTVDEMYSRHEFRIFE